MIICLHLTIPLPPNPILPLPPNPSPPPPYPCPLTPHYRPTATSPPPSPRPLQCKQKASRLSQDLEEILHEIDVGVRGTLTRSTVNLTLLPYLDLILKPSLRPVSRAPPRRGLRSTLEIQFYTYNVRWLCETRLAKVFMQQRVDFLRLHMGIVERVNICTDIVEILLFCHLRPVFITTHKTQIV